MRKKIPPHPRSNMSPEKGPPFQKQNNSSSNHPFSGANCEFSGGVNDVNGRVKVDKLLIDYDLEWYETGWYGWIRHDTFFAPELHSPLEASQCWCSTELQQFQQLLRKVLDHQTFGKKTGRRWTKRTWLTGILDLILYFDVFYYFIFCCVYVPLHFFYCKEIMEEFLCCLQCSGLSLGACRGTCHELLLGTSWTPKAFKTCMFLINPYQSRIFVWSNCLYGILRCLRQEQIVIIAWGKIGRVVYLQICHDPQWLCDANKEYCNTAWQYSFLFHVHLIASACTAFDWQICTKETSKA